jgi:dephospho-CoA kinase
VTRPFRLGLTGSIGMGKSTTAGLFMEAGVPVWDADAAVHRLYEAGAAGAEAVARLAPQAVGAGGVDRAALRAAVAEDSTLLPRIESAVHPLVAADRGAFVAANAGARLVVLDIPLLYETKAEGEVDAVLVVTAPPEVQRARVMARGGMDAAALAGILARQLPDAEKRRRADHVIRTDLGIDHARAAVLSLIAEIERERTDARDRPRHGDDRP